MTILRIGFLAALAACSFGDNLAASLPPRCGDGIVDPGEGCDDGNTVSGDGCSSTCQVETPQPVCGNGILESGEQCDDGNTVSGDGCSSTCQLENPPQPVCGNGIVEAGEQCDDGNTVSGDGCSSTCQIETTPPPPACVLVPQSGCSGTTPACDLAAADDGTVDCRAVTKQGTSDDHCVAATDCKAGFTCVHDTVAADAPWCSRFCVADATCTGTGSRCLDELTDNGGADVATVCTNACKPVEQTGCPSGMGCLGFIDAGGDYTDCEYMSDIADGDPCVHSIDCTPGSACVESAGTATCEPYCTVGDDTPCADTCVGFTTPLVIGGVEIGACN